MLLFILILVIVTAAMKRQAATVRFGANMAKKAMRGVTKVDDGCNFNRFEHLNKKVGIGEASGNLIKGPSNKLLLSNNVRSTPLEQIATLKSKNDSKRAETKRKNEVATNNFRYFCYFLRTSDSTRNSTETW